MTTASHNDVDAGCLTEVIRTRIEPFAGELRVLRIEREHNATRALAGTEVRCPTLALLCEAPEILGSAFDVMDIVQGRILRAQILPGMTPDRRRAQYIALNRALDSLHAVDHRACRLGDFECDGAYVRRQRDRWTRQYRVSETTSITAMENLIAWLGERVPPQDTTTLARGDYRLKNVVRFPAEPRIVAVLDWKLFTLGDPLVDFAYHCMTWHLAQGTLAPWPARNWLRRAFWTKTLTWSCTLSTAGGMLARFESTGPYTWPSITCFALLPSSRAWLAERWTEARLTVALARWHSPRGGYGRGRLGAGGARHGLSALTSPKERGDTPCTCPPTPACGWTRKTSTPTHPRPFPTTTRACTSTLSTRAAV